MSVDVKAAVQSQYLAALAALREAIVRCPEPLWYAPEARNPFWHVAYHALFYTHLYLQPSMGAFRPWARHRDEYEFLGAPTIGAPYTQADVLEYLDLCCDEVRAMVGGLDLAAGSGFDWLPMNKLELQLYTIRHLQHHGGELAERLGQAGIDVPWIGVAQ
jgi:hypothetical protein